MRPRTSPCKAWPAMPPGARCRARPSPGASGSRARRRWWRSTRPTASRARSGWRRPASRCPMAPHWRWKPGCGARCAAASPRSPRRSTEAFVPQMLNYESVGGVNFKKGCYPGQEVVARSQFRGTLKRRGLSGARRRGHGRRAGGLPRGRRRPAVRAGRAGRAGAGGGWDAIVSMQVGAAHGRRLTLAAADGPALQLLPLALRVAGGHLTRRPARRGRATAAALAQRVLPFTG